MSPSRWFWYAALAGLFVALALVAPAWTEGGTGKSYALLIGVSDYKAATFTRLKYTENDVEEMAGILDKPGSPFHKNVRLLTSSRGEKNAADAPTARNIRRALATLLAGKGKNDTILVGLAGHGIQLGVRDPERAKKDKSYAYFCPSDADLLGASFETGRHPTMILLSDLLGDLADSGAGSKLVLMDACRDVRRSRSVRLDKSLVHEGVAALFSCRTGQQAFETEKLGTGHGVFFHYVIEGLKGKAKDRRGRVTWNSLVGYVVEEVPVQVPKVIGGGASQNPHEIRNLATFPVLLPAGSSPGTEPVTPPTRLAKTITNSVGMKLVLVPAGKFQMGSPGGEKDRDADDEKQHQMEITKAFYMGMHEVTQKQFREVMGYNPSYFSADGKKGRPTEKYDSEPAGGKASVSGKDTDDFPVENVSYEEAEEFCKKLSAREKESESERVYRLPSEAEWEYTCRGGPVSSDKPFHFNSSTDSISSTEANIEYKLKRTCKVGSYQPNRLGVHDMHGNVWEWCSDWYDAGYYATSPKQDPRGPLSGSDRVVRGGGWVNDGRYCRAAGRGRSAPSCRSRDLGFRVAIIPH